MSNGSDSFWKPPMLKSGRVDWWKDQFEAHVCSLMGSCGGCLKGQLPYSGCDRSRQSEREGEKTSTTEADYKSLQQNARAKKVLYMALSPGDQVKMAVYKTAKEQWDGLARPVRGKRGHQKEQNPSCHKGLRICRTAQGRISG
ncbi:unnamed protein product [Rhodiola kirilowii]